MSNFGSWIRRLLGSSPPASPTAQQPKLKRPSAPVVVEGLTLSNAYDYSYGNLESFGGKPIETFVEAGDIVDFSAVAPRVQVSWDSKETIDVLLNRLLDQPGIDACQQLVIGAWNTEHDDSPQPVIDLLIARKDRLPNLRAVFFGDITSEQNEMSWIQQGDYSAFWPAYPALESFHARGGERLRLGGISHASLNTLVIQTGGLDSGIVKEVLSSSAPLRHLELWIGDENYGATTTPETLETLLAGDVFPELKSLGLCNATNQDDLVVAIANSPLLSRLETLDVSKGALTDKGGAVLAGSARLASLSRLIIAHHYMSMETVAALKAVVRTVVQSPSDPLEAEEDGDDIYYNIAVAE